MEEKTSGIVLSGINYGENDKILNIFTPDKGVVSAKIKGVKKAGAKLKFASEPFCFAEFIFSVGKVGRTVIGASLIDSFYPLREDIKKFYAGGTVLEFIKKFYRENIDGSKIFLFAVNALKKLSYSENSPIFALTEFLCNALVDSGYALNVKTCHGCGCELSGRVFFDYRSGGFYCQDCFDGNGREVLLETFYALNSAVNGKQVTDEQGVKGLKLLEYYLAKKTDENIKSLKELINLYTL